MKTVTTPTCANPLIIYINGKKFTYPAGATVEVPDEVAEIIERHEEAHPKPLDAPDPRIGSMVELSTLLTDGETTLSNEDACKMDTLNGAPCHIKLTYKYDAAIWTVVVYPTVFIAHDIRVYSVRLPLFNRTISVSKTGGSWVAKSVQ